jgi:hypothetical protein
VNDGRNVRPVREAIDRRTEIDTQRLRDTDVPVGAAGRMTVSQRSGSRGLD